MENYTHVMYVTKDSQHPHTCQYIAAPTLMCVTKDSLNHQLCHAISASTVVKSHMRVICATRDLIKLEAWYHI